MKLKKERRKRKRMVEGNKIFSFLFFTILAIWMVIVMVKSIVNYRIIVKLYNEKKMEYTKILKEYELKKRELEVMEKEYEKIRNEIIRGDDITQTKERTSGIGEETGK